MSNKILNTYKQKILSTKFDEGTISEKGGNIEIKTSYAVGNINFYELEVTIVEMSVTNLADDENKFYLHFELREISYAEELFSQMLETITDLKNQQKLKILLSCTGGLTTGFFADKLNEAAELLSLEYEFDAVPFHKLYSVAFDYSVILLAPQIAYQAKKAQEVLNNQLVLKIPPKVFASYDSAEMLKFLRAELENWKKTTAERVIAKVRKGIKSDAKILSIVIMPSHSQSRIAYRIYEKGVPIFEETVIKNKLNYINDLKDILDTVACRCEKFNAIGIATGGAIHDGCVDLDLFISPEINLKKILEEKYKVPVTITNNLKSAALGYYVQQDKYENIMFVSRPVGYRASGLGMVLNGKVFDGAHNMAGEIHYTTESFVGKEDWDKYNMTDLDKILDGVAFEIRAGISVVDPDLICLRCQMTPDIEKVKDKVAEIIPKKYLPEFVYLRDEEMQEYVLLGQMILSLESLETKN
ncbi:MAG: ROK family protein [Selenomonadaceae bacterium]|nr:ROK family protein [Selenomonadaceae bacterium]